MLFRSEIVVVPRRNSGVSDVKWWRAFGVDIAHLRDGLGRLAEYSELNTAGGG